MRTLLQRYRWWLLGGLAGLTLTAAIALAVSAGHRGGGTAPAPQRSGAAVDSYRGLGSWVDLWDTRAWKDPAATIADMASHGVRTVYVQTGTARSASGVSNEPAMREFISEAHARQMYVVAWYLPNLKTGSVDFQRLVQAVEFRTNDGQGFDSVALDIESTAVKSISARNANLATLSRKLRSRVGTDYPLGAIIPSPVGITKQTGFWNVFPYSTVAKYYDVILPMAYYTFHGHTGTQARTDALTNMTLLRAQPGCAAVPVHLIGGVVGDSSSAEVREFTSAARESGCIGASLYDWAGTTRSQWKALTSAWTATSQ